MPRRSFPAKKPPPPSTVQREFLINILFLVLINVLIKSFFIFGVDLAVQNRLPEGDYGLYFTLLNFTYLFQMLSDFGIQNFNNRHVSRHPHLLPKYFPNLLALKLVLSLLYMGVTLAVAWGLAGYGGRELPLLGILLLNQVLAQGILFLRSNVSGLGFFRIDSFLSTLDKLLMLITCGVLLWVFPPARLSAESFAGAQTLALGVTAVVVWGTLRGKMGVKHPDPPRVKPHPRGLGTLPNPPLKGREMVPSEPGAGRVSSEPKAGRLPLPFRVGLGSVPRPRGWGFTRAGLGSVPRPRGWRLPRFLVLFRQSFPYALVILLMTAYTRLDAVLLERWLPDGKVHADVYAGGYRLLDACNMLGYLFASLLLPMFARMLKSGEALRPLVSLSFKMIWAGSIALAAAVFFARADLVQLMMPERASAYRWDTLGTLIWTFVPVSATYIFSTLLTADQRLMQMNRFFVAGIALDVALNLVLIPRYQALGAAWATLGTQTFIAASVALLCLRHYRLRPSAGGLARILYFTIFACVSNYLLFNLLSAQWPVRFGASLLASLAGALLFRLVDPRPLRVAFG